MHLFIGLFATWNKQQRSGSENLTVGHAVRTASDSQTADALDGILESEPNSRL